LNCIPFELPGFRIRHVETQNDLVTIHAEAIPDQAACPRCHALSRQIHSHYTRAPRDLPSSGRAVCLVLRVRRFRCGNAACASTVFCERLPDVVQPSAQRTVRLTHSLQELGFALGGEAGSRQSQQLGMAASPSTVLRVVRASPVPVQSTPQVLGVDDFSLRKGQVYGTLLVDHQTHRPVDLVRERSAEALAAWLQAHPGVQILTRDRSSEYARGASLGAPSAVQVADRWHLLVNLREALERLLDRCRPQLLSEHFPSFTGSPTIYDRERRRGTKDQLRQQASRARRYARYAQVKNLQAQGFNILQIARQLHLSRQTVRKYLVIDVFPDYGPTKRRRSLLDPYVAYLQERWEAGCHDSRQLWRELRQRGFPGSLRMVWLWVALRRPPQARGRPPARQVHVFHPPGAAAPCPSRALALPPSRRLVWVLLQPESKLDPYQHSLRQRLLRLPEIERAFALTQQFLTLVRQRQARQLLPWIEDCCASGVRELVQFALGLQRELPVIQAALEFPYSNGLTEGHINRLKTIKRTMYGRANFDLLRLRVLAAA
jgi:transposase